MVQRHFLALAKEHEELVRQLSRHRKMLTEI
jgi:predicted small metal-binding protein